MSASASPFSFSILGFKPGRIYRFKPHETLFKTLEKNLEGKAVCVKAGVAKQSGEGTTAA